MLTTLPIAKIAPSQSRFQEHRRLHRSKTSIQEIANSIREDGVIQPIIVRPILHETPTGSVNLLNEPETVTDTTYEIIAGEGRFEGSKLAGEQEIPAIIREDLDEKAAARLQIIENVQRDELDPITEAIGYEELTLHGSTQQEIATECGVTQQTVSAKLKLLELTPDERELVSGGKLQIQVARELVKIPKDNRAEHVSKLLDNRRTWNREQSVNYIKSIYRRSEELQLWNSRKSELCAMHPGMEFIDFEESEKHYHHGAEIPNFESRFRLAKLPLDAKLCQANDLPAGTSWGDLASQFSAPRYIIRDGRGAPVVCVDKTVLDQISAVTASKRSPHKHPADPVDEKTRKLFALPEGVTWLQLAYALGAIRNDTDAIDSRHINQLLKYAREAGDTLDFPDCPGSEVAADPQEQPAAHHAPPVFGFTSEQVCAIVDSKPASAFSIDYIKDSVFPLIAPKWHDDEIQTPEEICRLLIKIRMDQILSNQAISESDKETAVNDLMDL